MPIMNVPSVQAFVLAGSAFWNQRGYLDVTDLGADGMEVPSFPASGELRIVLILCSHPGEFSNVSLRIGTLQPGQTIDTTHEFLDDWPAPPADYGFSTCRLTYSVSFTAYGPGTHGLVLFLAGEEETTRKILFQVRGPSAG
ncbi:hypothetical protein AB0I30_33845 [Nocardia tengchongensis]|uniref:hypothetical protein n=1 Tax=Nocardia tengchongensis TaxID=2055889 RepID=UPI0033F0D0E2